MAETKSDNHQAPKTPENPRKAIREARMARLKVIEGPPKTIKVYPANDTFRAIMKHPNGTPFPTNGGAEWPIDSFTHRRIAEGSVSADEGAGGAYGEADETKNPREQAAANAPKKKEPKAEAKAPPSRQPPQPAA